jgi:hypothetical protein
LRGRNKYLQNDLITLLSSHGIVALWKLVYFDHATTLSKAKSSIATTDGSQKNDSSPIYTTTSTSELRPQNRQ